jgi:hypothetical protein
MADDFEIVLLDCGHSLNSRFGIGVCMRCSVKKCGQCLRLFDGQLVCASCFVRILQGGEK